MRNTMLLCLSLLACGGDDEDRCEDPKYGNGTCDLETTCSEPDVDCFATFATPDEARAWYDASSVVPIKGTSAPPTDARFANMQALIDEGWTAYRATHEVGDLADLRVQLVLVNNTTPNAFVISDATKRAGLAVMVNVGLIDFDAPKEQLMGIVMHELEHAIGLHVIPEVNERFRRYYRAGDNEPLGFEQVDDPAMRALAEEWLFYADDVGYLTDAELAGLPLPEDGILGKAFFAIAKARIQAQPTACAASAMQLEMIYTSIKRDPIDRGVTLAATAPQTIVNTLTKLRDECFVGFTGDAIAHLAKFTNQNEAQLRAAIPAEFKQGIEGVHFINGIYFWVNKTRQKMREIETRGAPWRRVRYFSTEEAADDSSVRTLEAMGLPADGIGRLLPRLAGNEATCRPLVDSGAPIPYGENLVDDHHGTCWRAGHVKQVAGTLAGARTLAPVPRRSPLYVEPTAIVMD
jgi:hypothetical protein